jgi:2-polyprenyl-3-methyl-5-hydroxy-6-metoxy-1,4-benzoquinol methylase
MERVNELYSSPSFVSAYLDPARLQFYEETIDLCVRLGVVFEGKRVVDVGCGTGHLLRALMNRHKPLSVTGIEYAEAALDIAAEICPEAELLHRSIYRPLDRRFDVVLCMEVIEHLLEPDKALEKLASLLAPGGVLLVTAPNGRIDTFEGHLYFWSPESWKVFAKGLGSRFEINCGVTSNGRVNYMLVWQKGAQTVNQPSILIEATQYLNAQRPDRALELLTEAVITYPQIPSARFGLALALARLNQFEKAKQQLVQLLGLVPDHAKGRLLLKELEALQKAGSQ